MADEAPAEAPAAEAPPAEAAPAEAAPAEAAPAEAAPAEAAPGTGINNIIIFSLYHSCAIQYSGTYQLYEKSKKSKK